MNKEYDLKLRVKRRGAVIRKDAKVLKTVRIDADILTWLAESSLALRNEIRKIVREELRRGA